jgi:aspartate-semialdehyde dehydrogenase
MSSYVVGVDGARGPVGRQLIELLDERGFPLRGLLPFGPAEHLGEEVPFAGEDRVVRSRDQIAAAGCDILFCAPLGSEPEEAPLVSKPGALIIDACRRASAANAPWIVPTVNAAAIKQGVEQGRVAVPEPCVIALATALGPLHRAVGISRVIATVLEPVSVLGDRVLDEFSANINQLLAGAADDEDARRHQLAFNVLPQVGELTIDPARGSLANRELEAAEQLRAVLPTMGRAHLARMLVPVFYGLGVSVTVDLKAPLAVDKALALLRESPGLMLYDEAKRGAPDLREITGSDAVFVGRVRQAGADTALTLWIALDNVRAGAATTMVHIAEIAARDHLRKS